MNSSSRGSAGPMSSRRTFLEAAGALAMTTAWKSCGSCATPPDNSPMYRGKYAVGRALLGTTPNTEPLPFPSGIPPESSNVNCRVVGLFHGFS